MGVLASSLRYSELLVLSYLAYLVALAWTWPLPARPRLLVTTAAASTATVILALSQASAGPAREVARDWLPAIYLLVGYWLSGLFFVGPMPRLEAWLLRCDLRLLGAPGLRELLDRTPRLVQEYFEAAYLACYPLVPGGFAVLSFAQTGFPADRYWTTVLAAEFGCYGMLPWIRTRPPRAIEAPRPPQRRLWFARVNHWIVRRASIQVNTLPSGHAAGALATALLVWSVAPGWGAAFLLLAVSIAVGSVLGRYHYAVDAVLGFAWAGFVWWLLGSGVSP